MASDTVRSWTIWDLVGAFIDLSLAYFLLFVSAFLFLPYQLCNVFGFCLPCPCNGVLGFKDSSLCWHTLLIDLPRRNILYVQTMIKSNFPFDLIWFHHQPCNLCSSRVSDHGVPELESEPCSSGVYDHRESVIDVKGGKIVNQKQRYGTRRRRKSSLGYRKSSSMQSVVAGSSSSAYNGIHIRSEISGKEFGLGDYGNADNGLYLGEKTWDSFEQSGADGKNKVYDNYSTSVEKFVSDAQDNLGKPGNEENMISKLQEALQEERSVCAGVRLELEKERAAAASAADEAMAMILRLQADKAAIEMEARQYQRMIEEQFAYEEEEMEILKEILVRRERENHFLEKEVEAYRQVNSSGDVQSEIDLSCRISDMGQKHLHVPDTKENPSWALPEIEESKFIGKSSNWPPTYVASSAEVTSMTVQTCSGVEESLSYCGENFENDRDSTAEVQGNLYGSVLDSEPIIYDVHVIDDKRELRREETGEARGATVFGVSGGELLNESSSKSTTESSQTNHVNNSEVKNLLVDTATSSSPAVLSESGKVDSEVELLIERLRLVQEGKENLSFSAEQRESINARLKFVEDMLYQLQETQLH